MASHSPPSTPSPSLECSVIAEPATQTQTSRAMACEAPGGGAGHAWLLLCSWLLHLALVWQAWCPWGMGWFSPSTLLLSPALALLWPECQALHSRALDMPSLRTQFFSSLVRITSCNHSCAHLFYVCLPWHLPHRRHAHFVLPLCPESNTVGAWQLYAEGCTEWTLR